MSIRSTIAGALAVLATYAAAAAVVATAAASPDFPATWPPATHPAPSGQASAPTANLSGPWKPLTHKPSFESGTMLLQSDGTVLVHVETNEGGGTAEWWRLTPDAKGEYVDGTWSKVASMPGGYDPLYFASAILPDGRMIVEGGEYLGATPTWTNEGAIFNPASGTWRRVAPPEHWTNIGDAESDVLANGTFMLAQACSECLSSEPKASTRIALFNQSNLSWLTFSPPGKNDPNDEEGWTLLPSGDLLTVDAWLTPTTELFEPVTTSWSFAGNTVASPVDSGVAEVGPQVGMPSGSVFVVGAGSADEAESFPTCRAHKPAADALFDYATAKWVKAPPIPTIEGTQYSSADGPGTILPDGNVLFDASPCFGDPPLVFYEYEPSTNKLTSVGDVAGAAVDATYFTRLLALPNGQVLFGDGGRPEVYTAGGTPNPAWAPVVRSLSATTLRPGQTASLSGLQLSGVDQGAAYGDDVQDHTNFPLVRITDTQTGVVTYARTSNWTTASVAPGASSSTEFTVAKTTPPGPSTLTVVANGIASAPVPVTIK